LKYNVKMHEIEKNAGEGINTVGKLTQSTQLEINPVIFCDSQRWPLVDCKTIQQIKLINYLN
jgi:hypothetical protein